MTTSDASWSPNLRIVGDLERPDHYYLTNSDDSAFFGEYTAGVGWSHSATNQLIYNLKKNPLSAPQALWYKSEAIRRVAAVIGANLKQELLGRTVIVPIPPSKLASSPEYDDRMIQVARAIGQTPM